MTPVPASFNPKQNNFDLLRLFAATQVMLVHVLEHLHLGGERVVALLGHVPGVPIFFVISGFLISASYERAPNLKNYARNRLLRIYPALWVCLIVSLLIILFAADVAFTARQMGVWLAAQATVAQFYNPDFLRGFGVGVMNGSLWTISVELQFYVVLPLFYLLTRRWSRWRDGILLAGLIAGAILNLELYNFITAHGDDSPYRLYLKFAQILLPMHLYLFLAGMLLQRNYRKLSALLRNKALVWLALYAVAVLIVGELGGVTSGNRLHPLLALMLAGTVVSFADTLPTLAGRLLRGDISYGIYIYHMPILNLFLSWQWTGEIRYGILAAAVTYLAALASWMLVEKPALSLKKHSLHTVTPSVAPE